MLSSQTSIPKASHIANTFCIAHFSMLPLFLCTEQNGIISDSMPEKKRRGPEHNSICIYWDVLHPRRAVISKQWHKMIITFTISFVRPLISSVPPHSFYTESNSVFSAGLEVEEQRPPFCTFIVFIQNATWEKLALKALFQKCHFNTRNSLVL